MESDLFLLPCTLFIDGNDGIGMEGWINLRRLIAPSLRLLNLGM